MRRLWPVLVLMSLAVGAAGEVDAGTVVSVWFTATDANGRVATASFFYDQSHVDTTPGTFIFQGQTPVHGLSYTIGVNTISAQGNQCSLFNILTKGNLGMTFELDESSRAGCQVVVKLPTTKKLSAISLPFCDAFATTPAMGTATFTVTGGSNPYSGNITAVTQCIQVGAVPAPQCAPAPVLATTWAPALVPYSQATACQAPVSPPRRAGCLSRLFARRSVRLCRR